MKTAQQWFDEYGESHRHPINKLLHWVCVPSIFFSIVGLFASIPHAFLDSWFPVSWAPYVNFATLALLLTMIFYFIISRTIFVGMVLVAALSLWGIAVVVQAAFMPLWLFSVLVFVVAWIGQFIGHGIEGAKPSFFKDLQFLLVGPAWLLHFVYRKLGIPL
ncbi:MAG: DUF962 domain-containing protein [Bacteroidales bacterium]|nr:DUF962 domain-containing protein [Bacteroidales bacterium]